MIDITSTTFKVLEFHARSQGLPGVTIGELEEAIAAPRGTAVHQRQNDLINGKSLRFGSWVIKKYVDGNGDPRYWMPYRERLRALAVCRSARKAWREKQESRRVERIEKAQRRAA